MQNVETLGALERRIDISVPAADIAKEVGTRLAKLARTVRMPGFRPGRVPMKMIAASYGAQVQSEVLNDKVGEAFNEAIRTANLRVAGTPELMPKEGAEADRLLFSAQFEVYPDIKFADLAGAEVTRSVCAVGDAEVDRTIEIMRKQRAVFDDVARPSVDGDRLTVDFTGTIDGVAFVGGSGTDFVFVLGQGRMLPDFEAALSGVATGESRTFPVQFPQNYGSADMAGKTAQFEVMVKKVQQPRLPEVDAEFARALGIADGDISKMRTEVKANLDREVGARLKARTKDSVMSALLAAAAFDVPKSLVQDDQRHLAEMARADLTGRGVDPQKAQVSVDMFAEQAQRRVRLGLLVAELVKTESLQARQDQVRKAIEEIAQSYEKPAQVIQWYLGNRERLAEIETMTLENNVVEWVLGRAKVTDVTVPFDELMGHTS
jgi:trigger factor